MPRSTQQGLPGPLRRAAVRPAARPVDSYWQPNNVGPETPASIDLAPLSKSIQDAVYTMEEVKGRQMRDRALATIPDTPEASARVEKAMANAKTNEEGIDALMREFNKEIEANPSLEMGSPFAQIGFAEKAALIVMRRYESDLADARSRVSALVNDEGLPGEAEQPESVEQEVWDKYKDNVALKTGPGLRIANGKRGEIEARWRAQVIQERANNQKELAHREFELMSQEQALGWLSEEGPVSKEKIQETEQMLVRHGTQRGIVQAQDDYLSGVAAAVRQQAQLDPDGAQKILDTALEVKVPWKGGSKRAGDFVAFSDEAAQLRRQIEASRSMKYEAEDRERNNRINTSLDIAQDVGLDVILDGLAEGAEPSSLVNAAVEASLEAGAHKDHRGRIDTFLRRAARERDGDDPDPVAAAQLRRDVASGAAGTREIRALWEDRKVSLATMATETANARDLDNVQDLLEGNANFASSLNSLGAGQSPVDVGEVQTKGMTRYVANQKVAMKIEMSDWVLGLTDDQGNRRRPEPREHRDKVRELTENYNRMIDEQRIAFETEYKAATEELDTALRSRDVSAVQKALDTHAAVFSTKDRRDAQEDMQRIARGWDDMIDRAPAFRSGTLRLDTLRDGLLSEYADDWRSKARAAAVIDPFYSKFREDARSTLRKAFADHPDNPGFALTQAYTEIQTLADKVVEEADPELKKFRENVKAGASAGEALEKGSQSESMRLEAETLSKAQLQGRYAEALTGQMVNGWVRLDPDVSAGTFKAFRKWQLGSTEGGRRSVWRQDFERQLTREAIDIWSRTELTEDRRIEGIGSLVRLRGVTADEALNGSITFKYDDERRAEFEQELVGVEARMDLPKRLVGRFGDIVGPVARARKGQIEKQLAGVEAPLDPTAIQPFLTPIRGVDWDAHDEDPAVREITTKLMQKLGLTESQREDFITFQADANDRTAR